MPTALDRMAAPSGRRGIGMRGGVAAGCALVAHAIVLGLILHIAARRVAPAPETPGFALILSLPATPPGAGAGAPEMFATAALRPAAQAASPARLAPPPSFVFTPRAVAAAPSRYAVAAPRPYAAASNAPARRAPEAAAPAPDDGRALAALETRIDQAVRSEAVMPAAAIRQRREGRAQLRFNYVNGAVDSIAVAQSSQSRVLDDAAVRAVRAARYPAPPESLRGRRLAMLLWIDFRLASSPG